jgi:isoamylase
VYWVKEFHVDGFRFDLCRAGGQQDTVLRGGAGGVWAVKPERGADRGAVEHPRREQGAAQAGTGWAAWNNDFRYAAKDFARGRGEPHLDRQGIMTGSVDTWAANRPCPGRELRGEPRRLRRWWTS